MKLSGLSIPCLLLLSSFPVEIRAFAPYTRLSQNSCLSRRCGHRFIKLSMVADVPIPNDAFTSPALQRNARRNPSNVRYSDFLKLVDANQIDKVTFR